MRVQVFGANYEGAHFRGIPSNTDDTSLVVVLDGSEENIVRYISENFSYGFGEDDIIPSLEAYIELIRMGEEPMFDGCGAVGKIVDEAGNEILNILDDLGFPADTKWLDLGVVNVDESVDFDCPFLDHINMLVKQKK